MNMIFVGKIAVFSLVSLSIPVIGVFIVNAFSDHAVEVYGFVESSAVVVSSSSTSASGSSQVGDEDKKTFKCKANKKDFECAVWVIDKLVQSDKNHVKWAELTGWKPATKILEAKKFYKIETSSSKFDKKQLANIEVFDKDDKTLGTIKTMFIAENNKIIQGKTNLFVGQASAELQTNTGYKCSWTSPVTAESLKTCSILTFVSADADSGQKATTADFSGLKFTKTADAISPIKAHHFYLIKFTDAVKDSQEISSFSTSSLIYTKEASSIPETEIIFSKISMVYDFQDQLLILKQN